MRGSRFILLAVGLFLYAFPASGRKCPPITLGGGSPLYPESTVGGDVTMYRIFHTDNPQLTHISWNRNPSNLSLSMGRYHIMNHISGDTIRASIKLSDLKLYPDLGKYTVIVCSNCTCNTTTFVLTLFKCDPTALPQPVQTYVNMNFTKSTLKSIHIYSIFNGSTSIFFYPTFWTHNNKVICVEDGQQSDTYTCNRTVLENCTFYANLYINNISTNSSGNYTVEAVGGGSASHNSTVHINILMEHAITFGTASKTPTIDSCSSGPLPRDNAGIANFSCYISSYSETVRVVVVEDNEIEYYESTPGLSFGCKPQIADPSLAKCTVNISSTSAHSTGRREYKLCAGQGSQPHQCSEPVTVVPGPYTGLLLECSAIALLLVLLIVLMRNSAKRKNGVDLKNGPVLHTQNGKVTSGQITVEHVTNTPLKVPLPSHMKSSLITFPGSSPVLTFETSSNTRVIVEVDLNKHTQTKKASDEYNK